MIEKKYFLQSKISSPFLTGPIILKRLKNESGSHLVCIYWWGPQKSSVLHDDFVKDAVLAPPNSLMQTKPRNEDRNRWVKIGIGGL